MLFFLLTKIEIEKIPRVASRSERWKSDGGGAVLFYIFIVEWIWDSWIPLQFS